MACILKDAQDKITNIIKDLELSPQHKQVLSKKLNAKLVAIMAAKEEIAKEIATPREVINIYFGTGENKELSNFAIRPFTYAGIEYQSVEQAFQAEKLSYIQEDISEKDAKYNKKVHDRMMITTNGGTLKKLGREVRGLDQEQWTSAFTTDLMHDLLLMSFEQNPEAAQTLLATGDARLTHTQDRGVWRDKFPAILMEVREKIKKNVPQESTQDYATRRLPKVTNKAAAKHTPKELVKTRVATQFIGQGKKGSSTDKYAGVYKEIGKANTGKYSNADTVFVASNGARPGAFAPVIDGVLQGAYTHIDAAITAGADIIMDTKDHLDKTGRYNTGEVALANYLDANGYKREGTSGLWKKAGKSQTKKKVNTQAEKIKATSRDNTPVGGSEDAQDAARAELFSKKYELDAEYKDMTAEQLVEVEAVYEETQKQLEFGEDTKAEPEAGQQTFDFSDDGLLGVAEAAKKKFTEGLNEKMMKKLKDACKE